MKHLFLAFLTFLVFTTARAQVMSWEDFMETYAGDETTADAVSDWQVLHENPINLNDCQREDLLQIPFLSEAQIDSILSYVKRRGPILSVEELQFVNSMDAFSRNVARQFVYCGDMAPDPTATLWHRLRYGKNEVAANAEWPFYRRKGFQNGRYAGDRFYTALRYRYSLGQRLTAGVTAEKDDGEPMMKHGNGPFDSYSFYINYTGEGTLRAVTLGDYRVHLGQGLTAGSSYYNSAQSLVSSRRSRRQGFFAHTSADEVNYLRGAGVQLAFGRWETLIFASARPYDAILKDGRATSLLTTGYHRLPLERERKNNLNSLAAGVSVDGRWRWWHAGLSAVVTHYDHAFERGTQAYQRHNMQGRNFAAFGAHYLYDHRRLTFDGEVALTDIGALASLHNLRWRPAGSTRLFLQHRYYGRRYATPLAQAYRASGRVQNEHGIQAGADHYLTRRTRLTAGADLYRFPGEAYRAKAGAKGYQMFLQATHDLSASALLLLRYRMNGRQETVTALDRMRYRYRHTLRLQAAYGIGRVRLVTQLDGCYWQPSSGPTQWGRQLAQRAETTVLGCSLRLWAAWFHTAGYQSRMNAYQPALLYRLTQEPLYGHGLAANLTVARRWGPVELALRWNGVSYTDRDVISSAERQINHSGKSDLGLQLRCFF